MQGLDFRQEGDRTLIIIRAARGIFYDSQSHASRVVIRLAGPHQLAASSTIIGLSKHITYSKSTALSCCSAEGGTLEAPGLRFARTRCEHVRGD